MVNSFKDDVEAAWNIDDKDKNIIIIIILKG